MVVHCSTGNRFKMRTFIAIISVLASLSANTTSAQPVYESTAPIAYMVDMSSGAVLYDKNSSRRIPPASMAKMMTAYIVFDMIDRGQLKLDQKFAVKPETWKKWNNVGSTMFLAPNEQVSVENLLRGTITVSGNDAAITLAEGIAGSEAGFVDRMNAMAKKLGMKDSYFGTPNGWPDEGRTLTTARDLALLGVRTINDHPALYRKFYGQTEFRWGNITQADRNPLLGKIVGADGLKTGHTDEAGYCFTGTAEQAGRRIMMVVAGVDSYNNRIKESTQFMQWGFDKWVSKPIYKKGALIASVPLQLGTQSSIPLYAPRNLAVTYPVSEKRKYKIFVRYNGPIKAPFKKGDAVANLVVKFENGNEQVTPLFAGVSVDRAGFFGQAYNGLKSVFGA
jgi:serine-type D-Ala-D-Ala carboxypeptidase (penicillin-binding protein 5/6)